LPTLKDDVVNVISPQHKIVIDFEVIEISRKYLIVLSKSIDSSTMIQNSPTSSKISMLNSKHVKRKKGVSTNYISLGVVQGFEVLTSD
jgi:hypothetical protein